MQPNWAKIIGELIADHEVSSRKQIEPLAARIAEIEARPIQKGDVGEPGFVPPELAEQIAGAVRMLHEAPPVAERVGADPPPPIASLVADEVERQVQFLRSATGATITRDGELALSFSDGSMERLGLVIGPPGAQGPAGQQGADGRDGKDGADGRDGERGDEGPPGRDGAGLAAAAINRSGELMLTLSDGTVLTLGRVEGRDAAAA